MEIGPGVCDIHRLIYVYIRWHDCRSTWPRNKSAALTYSLVHGDAATPPLAAAAAAATATVYTDVDAGQVAYLHVLRVAVAVRQSDPSLHWVR